MNYHRARREEDEGIEEDDAIIAAEDALPQMAAAANQGRGRSYFWICALFMIYCLSFGLSIPAYPGLILQITDQNSVLSAFYYGWAQFLRFGLEFVFAPVIGTASDIKGRKTMLLMSFGICAVELLMLAFFPSIFMLFLARGLSGLGDVGITICYTIATDLATFNKDGVAHTYGLLTAMFSMALIIGPLLGGYLCSISIRLCLMAAALAALIGLLLGSLFLEETLHLNTRIAMEPKVLKADVFTLNDVYLAMSRSFSTLCLHLSNNRLRQLTLPYFLCTLAGGYVLVLYIFLNYRFGASPLDIGFYISFHGLVNAAVQGLLMRRIIPTVCSEQSVAWYGLLFMGLAVYGYCVCSEMWQLYVVQLICAPGAMYLPAVKALLVGEALKQDGALLVQGNLQGVLNSIHTLSMACTGLAYSMLFSRGVAMDPVPMPYLPFVVAGSLFMVALVSLHCVLTEGHLLQAGLEGPYDGLTEEEHIKACTRAAQRELDEEFLVIALDSSSRDDL